MIRSLGFCASLSTIVFFFPPLICFVWILICCCCDLLWSSLQLSVVFRWCCGDDPRFGLGTYRDPSSSSQSGVLWRRLPPSFPLPSFGFPIARCFHSGIIAWRCSPPLRFSCSCVSSLRIQVSRSFHQILPPPPTFPFPTPTPTLSTPSPSRTKSFFHFSFHHHQSSIINHPILSILSISCYCF